MASDPFEPRPPLDALKGSTAIREVVQKGLQHAGEEAVRQIEAGMETANHDAPVEESHGDATQSMDSREPEISGAVAATEHEATPQVSSSSGAETNTAASVCDDTGLPASPSADETPSIRFPADDANAFEALTGSMLQAARSNVEAAVSMWTSFLEVTSPAQALRLNADHMRDQLDAMRSQGREISWLTQRAFAASIRSMMASIERRPD